MIFLFDEGLKIPQEYGRVLNGMVHHFKRPTHVAFRYEELKMIIHDPAYLKHVMSQLEKIPYESPIPRN